MGWIGYALCGVISAAAVIAYFRERVQTRRIMESLNAMLDEAIHGDFRENNYNESLLSAVESRMREYLSASAVSARKLKTEKDKIKELIADISHQTKTPVSNILLYAQLLSEQKLPEGCGELTVALGTQAEKLHTLVDALVKLSRLETGVIQLHPSRQPLSPMLTEAVGQYRSKAVQKGVALLWEPSEHEAVFDAKWTGEAVCNLLDNAVKYTPAGGAIHVGSVSYEMFCRIDISDTGPGIPEEEQAKVFGRFYRSAAVWDTEGVGIGLYLARQIAAGEGGYIKLASVPGKGSVFSLFLPKDEIFQNC